MDHDEALHELADEARPRLLKFFHNCLKTPSSSTAASADLAAAAGPIGTELRS
jgi:hypothetical protein